MKSIRKVVTRSPHREVGIVNPGWLLDHPVEHESYLEKRFIVVSLSCPCITDITHQPLQIFLGSDEKNRYTPDFLIKFQDGDEVLVEVKPQVFVKQHAARLKAVKKQLKEIGYKYLIVTDEHIDKNGISARAMLLMRYGRIQFSNAEALECKKLLKEKCNGSARVKELVDLGVSEAQVWNMVASHNFRVPAGLGISQEEIVTTNSLEQGGGYDFFCSWFSIT